MSMRPLPWLLMALAFAVSAFAAEDRSAEPESSVLVSTETPRKGSLDQPVTAYGLVQSAPSGATAVTALHAAQIVALHVVQGQVVKQGEALVELGADPAAALAYTQAASDLKLARAELARIQQMVAQRLATQSQLDQAGKAASDAEAALEARRREGNGMPVETLTSPVDGVVTNVAVASGDHVQPGTTLIALVRSSQLIGLLGVTPDDRLRVKPGQPVHLIDLDAPSAAISAKIVSVGGMIDPKTGLAATMIAPDDGGHLTPGAHVRATIDTEPVVGWIVSRDAVLIDERGAYVFQVAAGKAVRVGVTIQGTAADSFAVSGPFDPTKKLVTTGNYQLSDGMAVREQASSAAPAPEKSK